LIGLLIEYQGKGEGGKGITVTL